jgi:hypothetical protein
MPNQNRVHPFGELFRPQSSAVRGALTGNRGRLHDASGKIVRPYEYRRWIFCRLDYPRPSHPVMAPGRWTHLFFLDEATALAAGHRPCAFCLYPRFKAFQEAWSRGNADRLEGAVPTADVMDAILHQDRITKAKGKVTYLERIEELPDGSFVALDSSPYLVLGDLLFEWTPAGYRPSVPRPEGEVVMVLTPRSMVRALASGYRVEVPHDRRGGSG